MKTLIINGSPRLDGDSVALVNEFRTNIMGEIYTVNTYYDNISPCMDCRYCYENDSCIIKDKMQEIYTIINEADNIVMSSPLYFSQLTGSILNFCSRLQYFYVSRLIRKDMEFSVSKKNGILILTGGGDGSPEPAIRMATTLFHQMNAELMYSILSLNTNKVSAMYDNVALKNSREIAKKLSGLIPNS